MEEPTGITAAVRAFSKDYGPYAFGIVSLLIVWFAIVSPTLQNNRIDTAALRSITESLAKTANSNEQTARLLESTAGRMERLADKINNGGR